MVKIGYIILGIIVLVAIVLGAGYFKLTKSPTTVAFLNIEEQPVEVNTGRGWEAATDQMELGLADRVRTGAGKASVVLYESIIIALDPNTEVAIKDLNKEHIKLEQPTGSTWNKFTGLAGIDKFSVETPTTVATVRGTYFRMGMYAVEVGEGKVTVRKDNQQIEVSAGKKAIMQDEELLETELSGDEKGKILTEMKNTLIRMKNLRQREIMKHPLILKQIKERYNITSEKMHEFLERADRGEYDLAELEEKSPVKLEALKKIRLLTEQIIKQNKAIEELT